MRGLPAGICALCAEAVGAHPVRTADRAFFDCPRCGLVQAAAEHLPDPATERARYESHENDPSDAGYRRFLSRLAEPLVPRLHLRAEGLDYGSGPGPTLSVMLEERGFQMATYDPFFDPAPARLEATYDFVTCTETIEHFHRPAGEFERLSRLLRPGGMLAVMTEVLQEGESFEGWWYARDPTHVAFYRPRTFRWIAERHEWSLERPHPNVAFFRDPG